ncbi:MAG: adenylate/guanylate cyclase domain-containing protein [Gemmatimonadetes bacterium]|nr:adenylate/guanylate cyclase domain-containing protein [Gemmatimonadota bacterium]
MDAPIRFLSTQDGVRIAYCSHGDGSPLVFVRGWISHLELMWGLPTFRSYFEALAGHFRLVRYDARGNGLSDQKIPEIDFEGLILDLEAVIDELALTDVTLYGTTFGGPIAIAYAARHPERVARLVLDSTYARGEDIAGPEQRAAIISTLAKLRTLPEAAFYMFSHLDHPEPDEDYHRRVERSRQAISGEVAAHLYSLGYNVDVSPLLAEIRVPTLVIHRRGARSIPFELGRKLAAHLPNAQFVPLEGTALNLWEGDAAAALAAIGDFLGVQLELATKVLPDEGQPPLMILFTDIEGSTTLTQRLGDAKAQELLRAHNTIVRDALTAHGGSEIKHTGDGIMASFPSASRSLECAITIQRSFARRNLEDPDSPILVRIGLNAGEPVREEDDLFGTAVQLAARIRDRAQAGQILASDVVRQLVAGKGFLFAEQGETELRGFEDLVRLYEVRWAE